MKKNSGAFFIVIIVIILLGVLGIVGLKYFNIGVNNQVLSEPIYGVISKKNIVSNNIDIWNSSYNDRFVYYVGSECGIIDSGSNVIIEAKYDSCHTYEKGIVTYKDSFGYVFNLDGELLLETEEYVYYYDDSYRDVNYYYVSLENETKIYDQNGELVYTYDGMGDIVGDFVFNYDGEKLINFKTLDKYRIDGFYRAGKYYVFDLYRSSGYLLYNLETNEIKEFDKFVDNDYAFILSNDVESISISFSGMIVEDYTKLRLDDKYILDYSVCSTGFKLYDIDGKELFDECYSNVDLDSYYNSGILHLFTEDFDNHIYFKNDKFLALENDVFVNGDFVIHNETEYEYDVYNMNGEELKNICGSQIFELYDGRYFCSSEFKEFIVDSSMNVLTEKYDYLICNENGACLIKKDNRYGLMINEEVIIEPTYYDGALFENYVMFEAYGGYDVISLDFTKEPLKKEDLVYQFNIDYGELDINKVIEEYSLDDLKTVILDNEELFKKYAYVVLTNDKVNGYRQEILNLFGAVVDNKEYLDEEYFLNKLSKLSIVEKDKLDDELAAGVYDHSHVTIELLYKDSYIINHELMHFIDYNFNVNDDFIIFNCDDEYYSFEEVVKLDINYEYTCEYEYNYSGNFITEAGAEFNMVRYTDDFSQAYSKSTNVYYLLSYLFGEEFMEDVYFSENGQYMLYEKMTNYISYEEYREFLFNLNDITDIHIVESDESYITIFKTLIDLYSSVIGGNWYEDEEFATVISMFVKGDTLNGYGVDDEIQRLGRYYTFLEDLLDQVSEDYGLATLTPGFTMVNGKTYIDIMIYDSGITKFLRIEYNFSNNVVVDSMLLGEV